MKKLLYLNFPRLIVLFGIAAGVLLWFVWQELGRTPREIIDYTEKRLSGHNRIESAAKPMLDILRNWFHEPVIQPGSSLPFVVPEPPPIEYAYSRDKIFTTQDKNNRQIWKVGPTREIKHIAIASGLARQGDIVEIDAAEYRADVATWHQKELIIRGVGGRARIYADGLSAEGKAIWVIKSGKFTVENIEFVGARVADRNGAGIRFEGGGLRVVNCLFYGNENGILASPSEQAVLNIERSEFAYNGHGDGQSHHLYVDKIYRLEVTGSYFHHANTGHLLKSRARNSLVSYNRLTDELGGRASYELDFPNGGNVVILGNIIQQSRSTENSTLIRYGEEGYLHKKNVLYLISNTMVNDQPYGGAFLRTARGGQYVFSANNILVGEGAYHVEGSVETINDVRADWGIFVQPVRQNYALNREGARLKYVTLPLKMNNDGFDMALRKEYVHPRNIRDIVSPPVFPGALQGRWIEWDE